MLSVYERSSGSWRTEESPFKMEKQSPTFSSRLVYMAEDRLMQQSSRSVPFSINSEGSE